MKSTYKNRLAKYHMRMVRSSPDYVRPKDTDAEREKAKLRMRKLRQENPHKYRKQNRAYKYKTAYKTASNQLKAFSMHPERTLSSMGAVRLNEDSIYFHRKSNYKRKTLDEMIPSNSLNPREMLILKEQFLASV